MTTYPLMREEGQSLASARALQAAMAASELTSEAHWEVLRLERDLRAARATYRAAQRADQAALRTYEATPYANAQSEAHFATLTGGEIVTDVE